MVILQNRDLEMALTIKRCIPQQMCLKIIKFPKEINVYYVHFETRASLIACHLKQHSSVTFSI
jgi:hypothetical protein